MDVDQSDLDAAVIQDPNYKKVISGIAGDAIIQEWEAFWILGAIFQHADVSERLRRSISTLGFHWAKEDLDIIHHCVKTSRFQPALDHFRDKISRATTRTPSPPLIRKINDVLNEAKIFLDSIKLRLTDQARQDISYSDPTSNNYSMFMDGFGKMYREDDKVHGRVDDLFKSDDPEPRLLFNTSGSGKTRLLVEGLCQHWGFYFTGRAHPAGRVALGSEDVRASWEALASSDGFIKDILKESPGTRDQKRKVNSDIARRVFDSLLLSRSLVLEEFLQCGASVTDEDLLRRWTQLQLAPFEENGSDIFTWVLTIILKCVDSQGICRELISSIARVKTRCQGPIWIVLDEAQIMSDQFASAFYTEDGEKKTQKGHGRSVLREMVLTCQQALLSTKLIVSGTGLSLGHVSKDTGSNVSKLLPDFIVWSDTGGFDTVQSQGDYIRSKLAHSSQPLPQKVLSRAWHWLRGRYRFTATFVALLVQFGIPRAHPLLNAYVCQLTHGYEPTDFPAESITDDERDAINALGPIDLLKLSEHQELRADLARATLEFVTRGNVCIISKHTADVVRFGFARTIQCDPKRHWHLGLILQDQGCLRVELNEPLAVAAALQYFDGQEALSIDALLEDHLRVNSQPMMRGLWMESVVMMALTRAFDGCRSLSDIFQIRGADQHYFSKPVSLQAITGRGPHGTFQTVPAQYGKGSIPVLGLKLSTPEDVEGWLNGCHAIFLFPPENMGPDIIFLVKAGDQLVWIFVQVKSRAKKLTPKEKEKAFKLVDPQFLCIDKSGKPFSPKTRPGLPEEMLKKMNISWIPVIMVLVSHPFELDSSALDELCSEGLKYVATFDVSKDSKFEKVLEEIKDIII